MQGLPPTAAIRVVTRAGALTQCLLLIAVENIVRAGGIVFPRRVDLRPSNGPQVVDIAGGENPVSVGMKIAVHTSKRLDFAL